MQGKKHKDALQWYKYNLCEPSKTRRKRAIQPLKSRILGVKSGLLGLKLERQNGTKRKICSQKQASWKT